MALFVGVLTAITLVVELPGKLPWTVPESKVSENNKPVLDQPLSGSIRNEAHDPLPGVLVEQGIRTGGEEGRGLLGEVVAAYRAALEVYTRKELPQDWAMTQNNLAQAYTALEDWPDAAASFAYVLCVYPDDAETYQAASFLYHERLFAFPEAFALNQQWLERHPEDLAAQSDFAERHFTTGRFEEAATRLAALQANPKLDPGVRIALRILEIASLLALDQTTSIPSKLESLRGAITTQPKDFQAGWSFEGTKRFISQDERLAPFRGGLLELFAAMEAKDRDTLLGALDAVRVKLR